MTKDAAPATLRSRDESVGCAGLAAAIAAAMDEYWNTPEVLRTT